MSSQPMEGAMKGQEKMKVKKPEAVAAPEETQIQRRSVQVVRTSDVVPQELLKQALENHESVEVIERLVALAKDVRAQQAREAWFDAMSEFQRTAPKILKTRTGDTGTYKWKYAPLEEMMEALGPEMTRVGLSVSWSHRFEERHVRADCHIAHSLGHVESSGDVQMPIDPPRSDGKGATAAQRVGIALSYAKRYSLMAIAGIAPKNPDEEEEQPQRVQMPKRTETPAPAAAKPNTQPKRAEAEGNAWIGRIKSIDKKVTPNYTVWIIKGADGMEFGTYDEAVAKFAQEAGISEVRIVSERTAKGRNKIVEIDAAMDEPGSEDGPGY